MQRAAQRHWFLRELSGGDIAGVLLLVAFVVWVLAIQLRDRAPSSASAPVQEYLLAEIPFTASTGAAIRPANDGADADADAAGMAQADMQLLTSIMEQQQQADGNLGNPISAPARGQRDAGREFEREFAGELAGEPMRDSIVLADGQRLLDVDFDLGARGASTGDLQIGKPVNMNGRRLGVVAVSIDRNSQLHLSAADLGAVLPEGANARLPAASGFVSFEALRASGFDIRYDPVADELLLGLPTRS